MFSGCILNALSLRYIDIQIRLTLDLPNNLQTVYKLSANRLSITVNPI